MKFDFNDFESGANFSALDLEALIEIKRQDIKKLSDKIDHINLEIIRLIKARDILAIIAKGKKHDRG